MWGMIYCLGVALAPNYKDRKVRWGKETEPENSVQDCKFERFSLFKCLKSFCRRVCLDSTATGAAQGLEPSLCPREGRLSRL